MIQRVIKTRLDGADSFRNNLNKTIPKLVFILIPLFALMLKLIYRKRKIPYFNHVLFSLHILAFYFLVSWFKLFLLLIASWAGPFITIAMAVYLFFALKKVYRDPYRRTFWKFLLLLCSSLIIVGIFLVLAGMISFAMV